MRGVRPGPGIVFFAAFALAARILGACISDEKVDATGGVVGDAAAPDGSAPKDGGDAAVATADDDDDDGDAAPVPVVTGHLHVFATSVLYGGNVNGASGNFADTECNRLGKKAVNPGSTYFAWMPSGTAQNPIDRLKADAGPWYNMRERTVVEHPVDLTKKLSHAVAYDEDGMLITRFFGDAGASLAWTGTASNGQRGANHCSLFTQAGAGQKGYAGDLSSATTTWTVSDPAHDCSDSLHLICFEVAP